MEIEYRSTEISTAVIECLNNKKKFFLLRMGDGEMIIANNVSDKLKPFLIRQIGRDLNKKELSLVQDLMIESVLNSTVLGLPEKSHINSNILWSYLFDYYNNIRINNPEKWVNKKYCSINSHFELLNSGELFKIFKNTKKIMIVSCRDIKNELQNKFPNITQIEYYSVPGEQKFEVNKNTKINIIDKITEIRKIIKSKDRSGELLIFGVGPFGKILGSDFALKNGVSLDLGSIFDLFVGKITRGKGKGPNSFTKPHL